ncbi:MAG: hypothetical protein PHQ50_03355 [Eubacteriales bacterium]|nr:hypothetical protein [Eubacteriales bacterium]MDD3350819.1 hypothetical protein [Eubacteriales bacterium]
MEKKCYQCGSSNVAKIVPSTAAYIPEIKKEIAEGRAIVKCCCAGTGTNGQYLCKDCGFQWDYYYERSIQNEKDSE